jgi:hypothetical protein
MNERKKVKKKDWKIIGIAVFCGFIFTISALFQSGVFKTEDTNLFTVVRITSTDNDNIQMVVKGTRFLSGPYEKFYSLPLGHTLQRTWWFTERVNVNGTWEDYEHGPFSVEFHRGLCEVRVIELNQNNVTIWELL